MLHEKFKRLEGLIRSYGSCLVAYSGGVDSVFLARVARDVLGDRMLAAIADSPSLPRRELQEALDLGRRFGFPVQVVTTREFLNADYLANPENRCYFCKHELFTELAPLARSLGFEVVAYGENASDVGDHRPGAQAAAEFQVRAPMKEVGLTKADVRALSLHLGLPTAEKPQMACLSSRIPYGERVTPEKLRMIEEAENVLRDLGLHEVRVRHHELPAVKVDARAPRRAGVEAMILNGSSRGRNEYGIASIQPPRCLARIEVGPGDLDRMVRDRLTSRVAEALRRIGYLHVTLDLQGYRRGSVNEGLAGSRAAGEADSTGNALRVGAESNPE